MTTTEYEELINDTRLFYRLPKRLFDDPAFEKMSIDAKVLYMILLDRRCLSEINGSNWRDDHGCVFIYFTIEDMMSLLNCGNKKVNELLKELENNNLVQRKHRGLGRPNRIYVYDLLSPHNPNWKPGGKMIEGGNEKYA
ncbi:MAG: hypothetical protein E7306_12285 [Butyrivibrio sp.]|nr:hypothetical protein [Butyrivibrio sp.]